MSTTPPAPESAGHEPSYQPPAPGGSTQPPAYSGGYAAAPAAPAPGAKPKGPSTLGLVAFIASLAGLVIGSILGFVAGQQWGGLGQYASSIPSSGPVDSSDLPPGFESASLGAFGTTAVAFVVWGALALWGFIQGIIAAVKNRGRGWAIAAIVLAVIGGGAVALFLTIGAAVGAAPYAA